MSPNASAPKFCGEKEGIFQNNHAKPSTVNDKSRNAPSKMYADFQVSLALLLDYNITRVSEYRQLTLGLAT